MPENFAAEFCGLPEYVVGHARPVPMSLGIRVYHWARHGEVLVPQFTAVLSAEDIAMISADVQSVAAKILSRTSLRLLKT